MFFRLYGRYKLLLPIIVCILFFITYGILSIVRDAHYQSFGYDLGINDQTVWRYAHFQAPLTTSDPFPDKTKLVEHVELVYALISPFYWIWDNRKMLLLLEPAFFCASGIAVYLLAKKRKLNEVISIGLVIGYLGFFGTQNAIWDDVHSASFAASFIMWFIYFLDTKKKWLSVLFFILAITAKENIGLLTFLISGVYFIKERSKLLIFFMTASVVYVCFIFFVYFPHIVHIKYLYENSRGLFSNLNPLTFADTSEKRQVIWYSLLSFGFLPLLSPLSLIPAVADLATYFVIANQLPGAQGLYGQYRITLAPLLIFASIVTICRFKKINRWYIGAYLIICTLLVQYILHLPISYLAKSWFWQQPSGVNSINYLSDHYLPRTASVVAQDNIVPHVSHRDKIYSLYPEKKTFMKDSPCGQTTCDWFRWYDDPQFLFVDTSLEWNATDLLTDRQPFIKGLQNLEKAKVITVYKRIGSTTLYRVNENPDDYK